MAISLAIRTKETGPMLLVGMNSWLQSSTGTVAPSTSPRSAPRHRTRLLRTGLATTMLTLALVAGIAHPAGVAAKKSTSYSCTTLESMFIATSKAYEVAIANGMTEKAALYENTTFWLEGIYLDMGCSSSSANLGAAR